MSPRARRWIISLFNLVEKPVSFFVTFHLRPKRANQVGVLSDDLKSYPKVAIIIQGPLVIDQDFSLETIRLYKKIFPKAQLIVSTWQEQDSTYVGRCRAEGVVVLENEKPTTGGAQNINYQIVSTRAGVVRASEMGAEYVLKTRSDQRLYGINSLEFLTHIVEQFPLRGNTKQQKRIVAVSLNTFKYRPYGISDMTLFGQVDDLLAYWNAPLDDDGSGFVGLPLSISEAYLCRAFLHSIGREIEGTLADSWRVIADHFCIVDTESLDIYWYKYTRIREYRYRHYEAMRTDYEVSFKEWLNLYAAADNRTVSLPSDIKVTVPIANS